MAQHRIEMIGMVFGRLTVVRDEGQTPSGRLTWLCNCECGGQAHVDGRELRRGHVRSCGCLRRERMAALGTKHWRQNHRHIRGTATVTGGNP